MASEKPDSNAKETSTVAAQGWTDEKQPVSRKFPGPGSVQIPLRIAMARNALADLSLHAKESLNAEICGVLAGEVCEDSEGLFVDVKQAVRGSAAREGGTHVTFTQETWNTIHHTMETQFPKLQIVGWYHSHPGFGVEFSEMDTFIQQNFFPSRTQIALVTDPLGGDTAVCINSADGIQYLDRFWVEGREFGCRIPSRGQEAGDAAAQGDSAPSSAVTRQLKDLEQRMSQLIQASDEQRKIFNQTLMSAFFFVCVSVAAFLGYMVYSSYTSKYEPPRLSSYVPIPVQVEGKSVLLGVGIVQWQVPPELNAIYLKLEQQKRDAEEKAAAKDKQNGGGSASPAPAQGGAPAPAAAPQSNH